MIPKRLTRALAASGISASLVAGLLAMPMVVLAATPTWSATIEPLPATVSPGATAGYELTVTNDGTSNISQLYLFADSAAPNPVYSDPSQGTCANPGGPLFCDLGQLRKGRSATIVVAFPTGSATGTFAVDFMFNTTGLGSGGGDNSHGDVLEVTGTTTISADGTNFAGAFVTSTGAVVANASINGNANQQSTALFVPARNIPAFVADGSAVTNDPGCPAGVTCVLETSQLLVGDGSDRYGLFQVVIQIDKTALQGINLNQLTVIHILDDETVEELDDCPRRGAPRADCSIVSSLPGGHGQVIVWLSENGFVKFH